MNCFRVVNARLEGVSTERRKGTITVVGTARREIVPEQEPHVLRSRWTLRQRMGMMQLARA